MTFDWLKGEFDKKLTYFSSIAAKSPGIPNQRWFTGILPIGYFVTTHCGSSIQQDSLKVIIRPPANNISKVEADTSFLTDYIEFLKNIHPQIKQSIEEYHAVETFELLCAAGHGYLNYVMMVLWRYLWSQPYAARVALYLHKNGFTPGEVFFSLAATERIWLVHAYGSHILEPATCIGKGIIKTLDNLDKLTCASTYSLQSKLQDKAGYQEYSDKIIEYYQARDPFKKEPKAKTLNNISPFKDVEVFRNLNTLKEFMEDFR